MSQQSEDPAERGGKQPRFLLSASLCDGRRDCIVTCSADAEEAVRGWLEDMLLRDAIGEECWIRVVAMTDAEVEALPDV